MGIFAGLKGHGVGRGVDNEHRSVDTVSTSSQHGVDTYGTSSQHRVDAMSTPCRPAAHKQVRLRQDRYDTTSTYARLVGCSMQQAVDDVLAWALAPHDLGSRYSIVDAAIRVARGER